MDVETHQAVFQWVLGVLEKKLQRTRRLAWTRRRWKPTRRARLMCGDTGERYEEFLTRLAKESGIRKRHA